MSRAAGIRWTHNPCRSGRKLLPETMGGGGGFLDFDNDGLLDILLLNEAPLPGYHGGAPATVLYRNNGNGTFTRAAQPALEVPGHYSMGAAVGDFDGDSWVDLYLTSVGGDRLLRNDRGRFVDVTARSGMANRHWSTGAAWIDYDHDGKLDLFIANYVVWSPKTDVPCGSRAQPQYCPPYRYPGAPPVLYRGRGEGTFEDVSRAAGILGHASKTLSVTPCDVNHDGWVDLYLANDTHPDVLLVNSRHGGFTDEALPAGVAVGRDGSATGSMGVDVGTPFNDGRTCIVVGNFVSQGLSLFCEARAGGSGAPILENRSTEAGLSDPTLPASTFGALFADVDADGYQDLLLLNGHLDDVLAEGHQGESYRQAPMLFQNRGDGTFMEVAASAGLTERMVGRGLAVGDYDNDGRLDFLAFENGGPVRLWHNETPPAGGWLVVELEPAAAAAAGAVVTVDGRGWSQSRLATTARSYLSLNDPRVHFGLGRRRAERLTVRWPDGKTTTVNSPEVGKYLKVREQSGS